ncbi:hypothetical protein [Usitatibacter palustris]|nr:hypothetical protein [Usitatibacter palustris]
MRTLKVEPSIAGELEAAGFTCLDEVAYVPQDELLEVANVPEAQLLELRRMARIYLLSAESGDSSGMPDV